MVESYESVEKLAQIVLHGDPQNKEEALKNIDTYVCSFSTVNVFLNGVFSNISDYAKYFILKGLQKCVKSWWFTVSENERNQIKDSLFHYIFQDGNGKKEHYLQIISNNVFVDIMVVDWPARWPNVIQEMIAETTDITRNLVNFFDIISILADFVTETEDTPLSSSRIIEMTDSLKNCLDEILTIIQKSVFDTDDSSIIKSGLTCLTHILKVVDLSWVFECNVINTICQHFLSEPNYAILAIGILTTAISHPLIGPSHYQYLPSVFESIVVNLQNSIGTEFDAMDSLTSHDAFVDIFVRAMTHFLSNFFHLISNENHESSYFQVLRWFYGITIIAEDVTYEAIMEFWHLLTRKLFLESNNGKDPLPTVYIELFKLLRRVIIERMPKPIKTVSVIDDDGKTRLFTSVISTYGTFFSTVRECIVFLTNFDQEDMMTAVLDRFNEFSNDKICMKSLQSLCWAIGSMAGSLSTENEIDFLYTIFQHIFHFCASFENTNHRICIAEGLCFISTQFHKFFMSNFMLFKSIFMKILDFVQEPHQELQSFAIDSLKALGHRCKFFISQIQPDETETLLDTVMSMVPNMFADIKLENLPDFYEFLSILINYSSENETIHNTKWLFHDIESKIRASWTQPLETPGSLETTSVMIRSLSKLPLYMKIINEEQKILEFIEEIIQYYLYLSEPLSNSVSSDGFLTPLGQEIISAKTEIIYFLEKIPFFLYQCEPLYSLVLSAAFSVLIDDFEFSKPVTKVSEVLSLYCNLMWRMPNEIADKLNLIFEKAYKPVMDMIQNDFESFPEFRVLLFRLIQSLCHRKSLFSEMQISYIESIYECLKWGCIHPYQGINDMSFFSLINLMKEVSLNSLDPQCYMFLEKNAINTVVFAFEMLLSVEYKSSFKSQTQLIRELFSMDYIRKSTSQICELLVDTFHNVNPEQTCSVIRELLSPSTDLADYRYILRDFLIKNRQLNPNDPDLFAEEKKIALDKINEQLQECPGFIVTDVPAIHTSQSIEQITSTMKNVSIRR